jgi:hypothetical protein
MSYNHWRNEAKVNSYFLNERSNEVSKYKEEADCYKQVIGEIRGYLIKHMMKNEQVDPKDLLDRIDGV